MDRALTGSPVYPCAIAGLVAVAFAGIAFGAIPHPAPGITGPIIYSATMLADVAACIMLLFVWNTPERPRSVFVLALSFATGAALTLYTLLAVPLLPQVAAVFTGAPPGIWLYVLTHVAAVTGALVFLGFRRSGEAPASRAFVVRSSILAALALGSIMALAFLAGDRLPRLANGVSLTGFRSDGVGLVLVLAFGVSIVLAARLRRPSTIDRALALTQLALGLDVLVTLLHGDRFSMSFYCGRVLQLAGSIFVLVAALRSLTATRRKTERDLERAELESAKRAARIGALWQIGAAEEGAGGPEARFARMLEIAAAAVRPGTEFIATLSHLERGLLVFDAVVGVNDEEASPARRIIRTGAALPLASTVQCLLYADGVTQAWNDIEHSSLAGRIIALYLGTRAMIGSPLQIGRQTHFIVFSSREAMDAEPFDPSDIAYIDVVASLFASTFAQIEHVGRLRFQMEHDALTGLKNRVEFRKAVRAQITAGHRFATAIVNLKEFRTINETHGQMVADELLVEIAAALTAVDTGNLVARFSGDEFGILLRGGSAAALEAGLAAYEALFRRPFHTGDRDGARMLSVDACLGASRFPEDGKTPEELVHAAGVALHVAKDDGHGVGVMYARTMEQRIEQRRMAAIDIGNAVVHDQLRLVYQPTFVLKTREIIGAEALVRWDHPVKGEISPLNFIPTAEKYGLVGDISRWVLRRVIRDLSTQAMPLGFRCYFNLSTQDIDDDSFVAILTSALTEHPELTDTLGVEITESGVMKNVERSRRTLDHIRHLGVRVAIDDFGTGHSSLSYLKRLAVDMVKIDRSFVTDLPDSQTDSALVESMIGICARLNLATLAEGIETEGQLASLLAHGCGLGQGYLVSRPLPFRELLARLTLPEGSLVA